MDCEQSLNLLSARLDGEITAEESAALDGHLAACADCRAAGEAMAAQHGRLVRAFAPRRRAAAGVADRVVADLAPRTRGRWMSVILAAAAGFLLAVMLFQPWRHVPTTIVIQHDPAPTPVTTHPADTRPADVPAIGHLALATGAVQICDGPGQDWRPMETGGALPAGARLRTGPKVRCELQLADGSEVRLNEATELRCPAPRTLELTEGQVWSGVAPAPSPFTVSVPRATVTALGTQFDMRCHGANTTLTVLDGTTRVKGDTIAGGQEAERTVSSGQSLEIVNGRPGEPSRVRDLMLSTRWVNEILVLKGRDSPELESRVDDLAAQIGELKESFLYEQEIRSLGDHCVVPLTRYIQSDRSKGHDDKRRAAAGILSDVAQPWCIPYLIELLSDRDGDVRAHAAGGLHRLTGMDLELSVEQWQSAPPAERFRCGQTWQQWWQTHKDRFPGATHPPSPPVQKARV
jgi:ferric-dicitrate binding protein FerR (iron transport regulator)